MKSLYTMVGMQYHGSKEIVAALRGGEPLMLHREPGNERDPDAVGVWLDDRLVAYIKGTEAAGLARDMDAKGTKSIVGVFRVGGDRWPQVEIDSR